MIDTRCWRLGSLLLVWEGWSEDSTSAAARMPWGQKLQSTSACTDGSCKGFPSRQAAARCLAPGGMRPSWPCQKLQKESCTQSSASSVAGNVI